MGLNANTSRVAGDFELLEIGDRTRGDTQEKSLQAAQVSKRWGRIGGAQKRRTFLQSVEKGMTRPDAKSTRQADLSSIT